MTAFDSPALARDDHASTVARAGQVLVKSRERVKAYGEVFTPADMVERMLDLVSEELESGSGFVDKTFFEPAAGDGNFLTAILRRKLAAIKARFDPQEWPRESLFALASIYAVELLEDNHRDAKANMLAEFVSFHTENHVDCTPQSRLCQAARFLIDTNVLQGNTLTGLGFDGQPLVFSWWHRVAGVPGGVQREAFKLSSLRHSDDHQLMMDFDVLPTYGMCLIDDVDKEG